ncbi:MAG: PorT family protein [Bacteroidales bacterium]|nr:PorT family protein [Bacteroidales bacterium]
MKKIFAAAAALLMLAGANAFAQISVGAGYLNSTLDSKYNGNKVSEGARGAMNGFYVGASYNLKFGEFGIAPGIYYSALMGSDTVLNVTTAANEQAINVPVNFNYGYKLNGVRLFAFAGPTVQFGIASKTKTKTNPSIETNYYSDNSNYSRFNLYLGGGLGADLMDQIQVTVGFDYGVLNLYKGSDSKASQHRYNLKLGVAYLF